MMPVVRMPDGTNVQFPDDMPPEQIKSLIAQKFPEEAGGEKVFSGSVLPVSKDREGNVGFDSDAGLVGVIKRALTLPGEVYKGEVDPLSDEGIGRAFEMATVTSPVNPAVRAGETALPGARAVRQAKAKPPTTQALKEAGGGAYNQARDMGVDFRPEAVQSLAGRMQAELEQDGFLAEIAPKTHSILRKLRLAPDAGDGGQAIAPLAGLIAARKSLRKAARDFNNREEQGAAMRVIRALDSFIEEPDPASVMAGPAVAAGDIVRTGRKNYAAAMRSDDLTGLAETAELRAAASNSGRNLGNTIRQRVASVLQDPKKRAGFNKAELKALESVARGTAGQNTLRYVGNLLGGGGGLGTVVTSMAGGTAGGAITGGPLGIAVGAGIPAIGLGAKAASNASTRRALGKADELVRTRSPLYQQIMDSLPPEVINPTRRSIPSRAAAGSGAAANEARFKVEAARRRGELTDEEAAQLTRIIQGREL